MTDQDPIVKQLIVQGRRVRMSTQAPAIDT